MVQNGIRVHKFLLCVYFCLQFVLASNNNSLPQLAGHSLTVVNDSRLLLIGGISLIDYYNERVFEYNTIMATWQLVQTQGSGPIGSFC